MKKIVSIGVIVSIALALFQMFPMSMGLNPVSTEIEKLTNNAEDDFGPSLYIDGLERPHIAWVRGEASMYDVYYGVKTGSSWDISKVTSLMSSMQFHLSLCLDSNGNPHIAALTETGRWDLWYMWWDESTLDWVVESVANGGTHSHRNVVSLAVDSTGLPHIAWAARWGGGLWGVFYAAKNGGTWAIETVSHEDDTAPSIALDSVDNPHVLWNNENYLINPKLRYASRIAGSWVKEDIPTTERGTGNTPRQLFIDSSNSPHIAFSKEISPGHYELWYGKKVGGSWSLSQIRDSAFRNHYPSLFLDSVGIPYVTWQSNAAGNYDVYLAKMEGGNWEVTQVTTEPMDEGNNPGPSLFIDSSDNIHLAWYGPGIGSGEAEIYYTHMLSTPPRKLAVVIGISDYSRSDEKSRNVPGATSSARDIYDLLVNHFNFDEVHLVTDEMKDKEDSVSRGDILDKLDWLKDNAEENDVVVFYFCGHADRLFANKPEPEMIIPHVGFGIVDVELANRINDIESERLLVIIASCHSGGFIYDNGAPSNLAYENPEDRIVLTACTEDELTIPTVTGVLKIREIFTLYFLEAFKDNNGDSNGDSKVTVEEAFDYTYLKVLGAREGAQHPQMYDGISGDFHLGD